MRGLSSKKESNYLILKTDPKKIADWSKNSTAIFLYKKLNTRIVPGMALLRHILNSYRRYGVFLAVGKSLPDHLCRLRAG